jgi:hypothetical protein
MILDAAETVLDIFGFDRTVYNSVVTAISVATTRIRDDEEESNGMKN